ncbi:MAG: nuclear transport factor 2 family protein [Leptospiraceae bacterium]|nr:nuclear transport factor 2 family protein [Leptospiraceae bacterium]MCP5511937.1 nuclear transport factor 2 family protein [Leptospiraceae bacterium]
MKPLLLILFVTLSIPSSILATDHSDLETVINSYFEFWSDQNMKDYRSLFSKSARIDFRSKSGMIQSENLEDFIDSQTQSHIFSPVPMKEIPLEKKITIGKDIAQVMVYWKLTAGKRVVKGWDFFVLNKEGGTWKIIYLIFQNEN